MSKTRKKTPKARKKGRRKALLKLKQQQHIVSARESWFRGWYRRLSCTQLVAMMGQEMSFRYIAQTAFYEKARGLQEIELRQLLSIATDGWTRRMIRGFLKGKGCAVANGRSRPDWWREPSQ